MAAAAVAEFGGIDILVATPASFLQDRILLSSPGKPWWWTAAPIIIE
jgi:hypothetical protein